MAKAARQGQLFWIRCLLHSIHIAVTKGLEAVADQ